MIGRPPHPESRARPASRSGGRGCLYNRRTLTANAFPAGSDRPTLHRDNRSSHRRRDNPGRSTERAAKCREARRIIVPVLVGRSPPSAIVPPPPIPRRGRAGQFNQDDSYRAQPRQARRASPITARTAAQNPRHASLAANHDASTTIGTHGVISAATATSGCSSASRYISASD